MSVRTLVSLLFPLVGAVAGAQQLPVPSPIARVVPRADWSLVAGTTGTPTQRRDNPGAASFDKLYVFGGASGNATTTTLNALYEYDSTTNAFTLKTAEGAAGSPATRSRACVAWDWTRSKLVVFGGDTQGATPTLLGDTWEWDPITNAWTNVTPVTSPSPRRFASMAWEPVTGGMLMFGGETSIALAAPANDTWLLLGGAWTQLSPTTVPPARRGHSLVTRPDFNDVFMCVGEDLSVTPQVRHLDAWRWNGSDWSQYSTATFPHGTTANQAIYDQVRRRVVVQGGQGISVPNTAGGGQYGDDYGGSPSNWTSEWDCLTNEWKLYGDATFGANDAVIGRISRYFGGFLPATGKVYKVSGQNPGTGTITALCQYQANPVASTSVVGAGCIGGGGLVTMAASDAPWTTRTHNYTVTGLAVGSLVADFIGFSLSPLPLNLVFTSPPGCQMEISLDVAIPLVNAGGTASGVLAVPDDPTLVSLPVYHQAIQIEGPLTLVTASNAMRLHIGAM